MSIYNEQGSNPSICCSVAQSCLTLRLHECEYYCHYYRQLEFCIIMNINKLTSHIFCALSFFQCIFYMVFWFYIACNSATYLIIVSELHLPLLGFLQSHLYKELGVIYLKLSLAPVILLFKTLAVSHHI